MEEMNPRVSLRYNRKHETYKVYLDQLEIGNIWKEDETSQPWAAMHCITAISWDFIETKEEAIDTLVEYHEEVLKEKRKEYNVWRPYLENYIID